MLSRVAVKHAVRFKGDEQDMGGTIFVICILAVIVVGAVISSAKHFKGDGGCCGGGGSVKVKGDHIKEVVAVRTIYIEGMHCHNCSDRVQNELNSLGQVNAKVDLKKQHAVVKLGREVSDDELKACVEKAGYTVRKID